MLTALAEMKMFYRATCLSVFGRLATVHPKELRISLGIPY